MKPLKIPLILPAMILLMGCSNESERVAYIAEQAMHQQSRQNEEMARLNREIAAATERLVAADADARQEILTAHQSLVEQRDALEVGGFGLSHESDLLFIEDVQLVKQVCSWAHVAFDDESVADFFDVQVDAGRQPEQFARIWIHTHPGDCPLPSGVDEKTFERVFGKADWSVMFILARGGETYARLRYNRGPSAEFEIPVTVDYSLPFAGSNRAAWEQEYQENVQNEELIRYTIPQLAAEFLPTDELALADDWPEGWFESPEAGFLPEEFFEDEHD